jgi:hypothetical protein
MALRITAATSKVGIILVAVILGFALGFFATSLLGPTAGALVLLAVTVATVVFCGRIFRADGEPTAPPRPAWRLTGGTTPSVVMAVIFTCQALSALLGLAAGDDGAAVAVVSALVYAALAAAYVVSAVTQRAGRLREQNPRLG